MRADLPPLAVVGLVQSKSFHTTKTEANAGFVAFHRITRLDVLITLVPKHSVQLSNLTELTSAALKDSRVSVPWELQGRSPSFQEIVEHSQHLFSFFQRNANVEAADWEKLQSNLLPAEWAELLEMSHETFPLVVSEVLADKPVPPIAMQTEGVKEEAADATQKALVDTVTSGECPPEVQVSSGVSEAHCSNLLLANADIKVAANLAATPVVNFNSITVEACQNRTSFAGFWACLSIAHAQVSSKLSLPTMDRL